MDTSVAVIDIPSTTPELATIVTNMDWQNAALIIVVCTALCAWSIQSMTERWFEKEWVSKDIVVIGEICAIGIAVVFGAILGWRLWDPWLGALAGLLGGSAAEWFIGKINRVVMRYLNGRKGSEEESSSKKK